jgi:mono/diheme cytochrome c family protein
VNTIRRAPLAVKIIGGLIALVIAIQLIPVWLLQTNPPVTAEPQWDSPQTRALAQRACFDCHSDQTK